MQLVRDTQFAVIGVLLLACLARVVKVLGLMEKMMMQSKELKTGLEAAVELVDEREDGRDHEIDGSDFGEKIERRKESDELDDGEVFDTPRQFTRLDAPKKKKKRNPLLGDEIDNIFGGLS